MAGHDRFVADLRPLLERAADARRRSRSAAIRTISARSSSREELGVIVTDATGAPLDAPLDVEPTSTLGRLRERRAQSRSRAALRRRWRAAGCCDDAVCACAWHPDDASATSRDSPTGVGGASSAGRGATSRERDGARCSSRARRAGSTSWAASPTTPARSCCSGRSRGDARRRCGRGPSRGSRSPRSARGGAASATAMCRSSSSPTPARPYDERARVVCRATRRGTGRRMSPVSSTCSRASTACASTGGAPSSSSPTCRKARASARRRRSRSRRWRRSIAAWRR